MIGRGKTYFLATIVFSAVLIHAATTSAAPLVINEIMFNPDGDENAREFVELRNISDNAVSLENFLIGDGAGFDSFAPVGDSGWIIPQGAYALILDPDYFDNGEFYDGIPAGTALFTVTDKAIGSRGLSNSTAERISLVSGAGDTLSTVTYSLDCPPGHSWERILPGNGDGENNFSPSAAPDGTPGLLNSATPPSFNPVLDSELISILPPDPGMGSDLAIRLSYRNDGRESVSGLSASITMLPGIFVGSVSFGDTVERGAASEHMTVYVDDIPGGVLEFEAILFSDSDSPADTLMMSVNVPIPSGTIILSEIMAAPDTGDAEWIELYNSGGDRIDLFGFGVLDNTDGYPAKVDGHVMFDGGGFAVLASGELPDDIGDMPVILIDGFPKLNNDGDTVRILDYSGAVSDSMSYDDTSKGMSLERMSASDGDASSWDVSTDAFGSTPGRVNSISFDMTKRRDTVKIEIEPNPFEDYTVISYELPFPLARVSLYIYDRRGRLIGKIRDGEESGSVWSGNWDGRSGGSIIPAGPYILSLEAIDKQSGRILHERKTIVKASRL